MTAKSSRSTEKLFDEISLFVEESRNMLAAGAMMELAGLDAQVRLLCEALLRLSQDERMLYADRLQQLFGDLKSLGDAMVVQRDQLAEEIRTLPKLKKASVAYRITDASDDFGRRDDETEQ